MSTIVSFEDIQGWSDKEIADGDAGMVENLISEAVSTVEGYLYPQSIPLPLPRAIRNVVCRMVVRVLDKEDLGHPENATGLMNVAGSFTQQYQFSSSGVDGGVWLGKQDRIKLRPFKRSQGVRSVEFQRGRPSLLFP